MTAPAVSDVFRGDRALLIAEFADSEYRLARELAAVRVLLHLALGQSHEWVLRYDRLEKQHRRLRDEYRSFREHALRDDRRAA